MPDALRRAIRTFVQSAIAVFLAMTVTPGVTNEVPTIDLLQRALIAAAWAGAIAVLAWLQNALEDEGFIKAFLKAPASPGADPVPDPGPGRRQERHGDQGVPPEQWGINRK